jgi:hypothetical protein
VRLSPDRLQPARDWQGVFVTTWVRGADVLPAKPADPPKVATMLCAPAAAGVVVQLAWPVPAPTGWEPHPAMGEPLSVKLTVPPSGAGLTVHRYRGPESPDFRGGHAAALGAPGRSPRPFSFCKLTRPKQDVKAC